MISLPEAEVHIWRASLDPDQPDYSDAWDLLSDDERTRTGSGRFTAAAVPVHELWPGEVAIEYGSSGKPRVASSFRLHFNLSHSQDQAVLAFGRYDIGVDSEATRPVPDALNLAERFFAPDEITALRGTAPAQRTPINWIPLGEIGNSTTSMPSLVLQERWPRTAKPADRGARLGTPIPTCLESYSRPRRASM